MDKNFYDTLQVLNNLKIRYYCICGTMLGLHRDGDLIPWDKDIDIAIFANSTEYSILIDTMRSKGFKGSFQRNFRPGKPSLKFLRAGGRKVEFNTPLKKTTGEYCLEWYKSASPLIYDNLKFYQKMTLKFLKIIGRTPFEETQVGIKPCLYVEGKIKRVMCFFLRIFFSLILKINYWLRKITKLDSTIGYYSKRINSNNITIIDYHGLDCSMPADSEGACIDFYGPNWRVPKDMNHYSDFYKDSSSKKFLNDQ
tara:strand:- start:1004 stop:1762 length:759 start_codon:yes stop_codon:yes gene_type:complete